MNAFLFIFQMCRKGSRQIKKKVIRPSIPSPPGETLLEIIQTRGLTVAEVAARMGVKADKVNDVIHNNAPITADLAQQLMKVLGVADTFWLRREKAYREHLASHELPEEFSSLEEAGEFWDNHDITNFAEHMEDVDGDASDKDSKKNS